MTKPESRLQGRIIKALRSRGCYVVNVVTAGEAGVPDIVLCASGLFYALEVKMPGKMPTRLQNHHLQRVTRSGGTSAVVRSVEDALRICGFSD